MIKFFNRFKTVMANDGEFFRNPPVSLSYVCISELNRKFAMFFLNHEIRKNGMQNWGELFLRNDPLMFCLPMWIFFAVSEVSKTSEVLFEPINKNFISGYDVNTNIPSWTSILLCVTPDGNATLSVDNSSKISKLRFLPHSGSPTSLVSLGLNYIKERIKCTATETNPNGIRKNEVIVRASWKHEEVSRNDLLAA